MVEFSNKYGGCVISLAINKYVYIIVNKRIDNKIRVGYSKTEIVDSVDEIQHDIVKHCLKRFGITGGIEIVSVSDIPSSCGLSSSSAFTVGLLLALYKYCGIPRSRMDIAIEASQIELALGKSKGLQDCFGVAFGGIKYLEFSKNGNTKVTPLWLETSTFERFEKMLKLYQVGQSRNAIDLLNTYKLEDNTSILIGIKEQCENAKKLFNYGVIPNKLNRIGMFLRESWYLKKQLSPNISNETVEEKINYLYSKGAIGCKLAGAGAHGFVLAAFPEGTETFPEGFMDFKIDTKGTKIISKED